MDAPRDGNGDGAVALMEDRQQAARASDDDGLQQQPTSKKRRVDDDGATTTTSSCNQGADEDEVAKLRNQVKQLKKIACQALSGFKETAATRRRFQFDEDVSEEWKNDADIVAAALQGERLDWWDLPDSLKYDTRVAKAVFVSCDAVRLKSFGELSVGNPQDVMLAALCHPRGSLSWAEVPEDWRKNHRGLALYGVEMGDIQADDCPCLLDRDFMKDRLEKYLSPRWLQLPTILQSDIEFARSIQMFPSPDLPSQILANFPAISGERNFWKRLVVSAAAFTRKRKIDRSFVSIFQDFASREIRSDRELMVEACSSEKGVMDHVDVSLARDHDFLLECVKRNWNCISKIPRELQRLFPDVVDQALLSFKEEEESFVYHGLATLAEHLDPIFWADRAFLLRWFKNGLPLINDFELSVPPSPGSLTADAEIFLLIAKHCKPNFLHKSFCRASASLINDRKFMLKVGVINPVLLIYAGPWVRNDFELCLIAFSHRESAEHNLRIRRHYLEDFKAEANVQLALHSTFCSLVLPAISLTSSDSGCALAVLNQGTATAVAYKKLIGEFLHVPTGKRLRSLRQACRNLDNLMEQET